MNVSQAEQEDLKYISELWFRSFKYNFYTILGKDFILNYLIIAYTRNQKFFFKLAQNNKIRGFVIYGDDFLINKIFMKKNFVSIFLIIIKNLFLLKIFKAFYLIQIIFYFMNKNNFTHLAINKIELIIICIDGYKIRKGLGRKLLRHSINKIFKTSYIKKIYVKTAYPSKKTVKFYINSGFKFYKKTFYNKWQLLSLSK